MDQHGGLSGRRMIFFEKCIDEMRRIRYDKKNGYHTCKEEKH